MTTQTEQKNLLGKLFKDHQTLVVVGGNWGDEGKGKVIDLVMDHYDIVARFSGGSGAGHTVKTPKGVKIVSHLIPCGLAQNKVCVMARGEFFDLKLFLKELEECSGLVGGRVPPIWIDQMSPLWTPWHALLENWLEHARGNSKVGTTGKGIGPLEGLFKLRISPLVGNLFSEKDKLVNVLNLLYQGLLPIFSEMQKLGLATDIPTPEQVAEQLLIQAPLIAERVVDTAFVLHEAYSKGQRVMFEGAQATGLDSHWGTYPFVSSGNSVASGAAIGTGLPMEYFKATIMVCKTLPTRVGAGPFPSEMGSREASLVFPKQHPEFFEPGQAREEFLKDKLAVINQGQANPEDYAQYFQVLGDERGATTGRGRSVGFLDIPWLRYANRINNPKFLALTRFDMLSGVKQLPVVVGYKYKGQMLAPSKLPPTWQMDQIEPVYENWPCWQEDIYGINDFAALPKAAQEFLLKLEQHLNVHIALVGTGPERDAIVVR